MRSLLTSDLIEYSAMSLRQLACKPPLSPRSPVACARRVHSRGDACTSVSFNEACSSCLSFQYRHSLPDHHMSMTSHIKDTQTATRAAHSLRLYSIASNQSRRDESMQLNHDCKHRDTITAIGLKQLSYSHDVVEHGLNSLRSRLFRRNKRALPHGSIVLPPIRLISA